MSFVLGQYGYSLEFYLGKLISLSLARKHSTMSANTIIQLLAGLFGEMPSGEIAKHCNVVSCSEFLYHGVT